MSGSEDERRVRRVRRLGTVFYILGLTGLMACIILLFTL